VFATNVSVSENQNIIVERKGESWKTAGQYLDVEKSNFDKCSYFIDVIQRTLYVHEFNCVFYIQLIA